MFNAAHEIERMEMLLESGGGRYWEGRYRDEAVRVDELERVLIQLIDYADMFDVPDRPLEEARTALGEKKDEHRN